MLAQSKQDFFFPFTDLTTRLDTRLCLFRLTKLPGDIFRFNIHTHLVSFAVLSISEVLNRPLPPLSWRSNNPGPSSTTHSAYSRTPIEVREWTEFATQAAAQILPTNRTLRSEDYVFRTNLAASNEDSVGSALDTNVYNLLNSLQTTAWIGTRSEIGGVLGEPDRVCYIQLSQELRIVMEIKTTRALSCNNLVTKYLEDMALIADGYAPANPTWRQVHQVFGYMCHNNLRYGIFTTYDDTWFMTREAGRLWISPSIRHNSTQPSVLKCYRYLMELADQGFTSPSPAPSPRPSPPPSPPGDDSNDDPKDGSHQGRKKQTRKQDQQRPGIVTRSRNKVQQIFRKLPNGFTVSVGKLSLHEFDIQELLGEGRTGRVFRATWKGESVALKVCDLYKHPEYEDEILSEVAAYKALEDLQGVCIPHFKIAGYDGGLFSIAMEIAGSPMEVDKLSSQERLKIADGLLLIHQHGIMHNDIRVYNILVCNGDGFQVHFIDFAQSRRTSDKRELRKEMVQLKSLLKIG
ncbi:kinase-like domain-containing protein [Dissophora ornata]|nr:kinase-like domain-containing protein [Dissophora ornata]